MQSVSSVNLKILDIVARWPGAAHDQHIFNNSRLKQRFEQNEFGNSLLVGDCGYRNTPSLITPLINTNNEVEQLYNEAVIRTRNPVERQYGVWKRRFPVIGQRLRLKLDTAMSVIVAAAVLHNIAVNEKEDVPPVVPGLQNPDMNFQWHVEPLQAAEDILDARTELIIFHIYYKIYNFL